MVSIIVYGGEISGVFSEKVAAMIMHETMMVADTSYSPNPNTPAKSLTRVRAGFCKDHHPSQHQHHASSS